MEEEELKSMSSYLSSPVLRSPLVLPQPLVHSTPIAHSIPVPKLDPLGEPADDPLSLAVPPAPQPLHTPSNTPLPVTLTDTHTDTSDQIASDKQTRILVDVNRELKRLLVASVGNELEAKLNQLTTEKVKLAIDLDVSVQKISEYREEVDELCVECDVWRSKFLASRVLIDELSRWGNSLFTQCSDSQKALRALLKERAIMFKDLGKCHEDLRQTLNIVGEMGELSAKGSGASRQGGAKVATVAPIQLSEQGRGATLVRSLSDSFSCSVSQCLPQDLTGCSQRQ